MKPHAKKLALHADVVRRLDGIDLRRVRGGLPDDDSCDTCDCDPSHVGPGTCDVKCWPDPP